MLVQFGVEAVWFAVCCGVTLVGGGFADPSFRILFSYLVLKSSSLVAFGLSRFCHGQSTQIPLTGVQLGGLCSIDMCGQFLEP